mgnify:CR=1 FL=1
MKRGMGILVAEYFPPTIFSGSRHTPSSPNKNPATFFQPPQFLIISPTDTITTSILNPEWIPKFVQFLESFGIVKKSMRHGRLEPSWAPQRPVTGPLQAHGKRVGGRVKLASTKPDSVKSPNTAGFPPVNVAGRQPSLIQSPYPADMQPDFLLL